MPVELSALEVTVVGSCCVVLLSVLPVNRTGYIAISGVAGAVVAVGPEHANC